MFKEDSDPIKDMNIGYIGICRCILKKMDGIILSENETWQENKWRHDEYIWTEKPNIKTAADFDWLDKGLFTKIARHSIVVGIEKDTFVIFKNLYFQCAIEYIGDIHDLYDVITYWYNKKRKYRQRKRWRHIEDLGFVYI